MSEAWWDATDPGGRPVREFKLTRPGSERAVTGALWSPTDATTVPSSLVLFGHGASGDRYQAPICHLAHRLADEAACSSLAIDGPVHGLRQVGVGGRQAFAEEMKRATFVDDMVADWHAALAATRREVDVGRLGYLGLSMGSMFGIPLLASLAEVEVAVLGLLGTTWAGRRWRSASAEDVENPKPLRGRVSVDVLWPGASAGDMEKLVTTPLERYFQAIPKAGAIWGLASANKAFVEVEFEQDADVSAAVDRTKQAIGQIRSFPAEIEAPPAFAERVLGDAAKITCPVLYLMQLEDELFSRAGYIALFDALASTDKRLHANPGLHPQVPAEEVDFAFGFLHRHLGAGSAT